MNILRQLVVRRLTAIKQQRQNKEFGLLIPLDRIARLVSDVVLYRLATPPCYRGLTLEVLQQIYNGCGPDWMPEASREVLTRIFTFFEPAFLIHDVEYQYSDGTRDGFQAANRRLYNNCRRLIREKCNFRQHPAVSLWYEFQAWNIYQACRQFGWSAWCDE